MMEGMEGTEVPAQKSDRPMGTLASHSQPEFADMVLVQTLDQSLLPTSGKHKGHHGRLVIVGDVHGMKDSLIKLLDKVEFDKRTDHLVLAGDMISKGPDSRGVLDLVMDLGATAVRGNHEDRILLAHKGMHSKQVQMDSEPTTDDADERDEKLAEMETFSHKGEYKDRLLAKQLSRKHIEWLKKCPVILKVGDIEGMGEVLVVHGGLVPGLKLRAQDPFFVMNMRTIDMKKHVPSDRREGTEWTKVFIIAYITFWTSMLTFLIVLEPLPRAPRATPTLDRHIRPRFKTRFTDQRIQQGVRYWLS